MSNTAESTDNHTELPERAYKWFNSLVGRKEPVREAEVRALWTDDCVMITNSQTKCTGISAFVKHFNEIHERLKSWEVELPLAIKTVQGDRIAAYYRIRLVKPTGEKGTVFVGAFFETRDGKLAKMTEVAHFEGVTLLLENH
jgi:hypothetical protein